MFQILVIIMLIMAWISGFILGRRYEAYNIRMQLLQKGCAETKYGDYKFMTIKGKVY